MQAAGRALEFECAIALGIEGFRLCGGTGDQFDLRFIERIDQRDETGS